MAAGLKLGAGTRTHRRAPEGESFTHADGRRMAEDLPERDPRPTAIVAGCDTPAFGVNVAARDRHLRVPEDLSVVGFDDTFLADSTAPPLSTSANPARDRPACRADGARARPG
ncbi:MAG TPA: substrate-binding domain-containing protein [Nakamurella sp.]